MLSSKRNSLEQHGYDTQHGCEITGVVLDCFTSFIFRNLSSSGCHTKRELFIILMMSRNGDENNASRGARNGATPVSARGRGGGGRASRGSRRGRGGAGSITRLRLQDKEKTCIYEDAVTYEAYKKNGRELGIVAINLLQLFKNHPDNRVRPSTKTDITTTRIVKEISDAQLTHNLVMFRMKYGKEK